MGVIDIHAFISSYYKDKASFQIHLLYTNYLYYFLYLQLLLYLDTFETWGF